MCRPSSLLTGEGKEPNHTTARKPGPLQSISHMCIVYVLCKHKLITSTSLKSVPLKFSGSVCYKENGIKIFYFTFFPLKVNDLNIKLIYSLIV